MVPGRIGGQPAFVGREEERTNGLSLSVSRGRTGPPRTRARARARARDNSRVQITVIPLARDLAREPCKKRSGATADTQFSPPFSRSASCAPVLRFLFLNSAQKSGDASLRITPEPLLSSPPLSSVPWSASLAQNLTSRLLPGSRSFSRFSHQHRSNRCPKESRFGSRGAASRIADADNFGRHARATAAFGERSITIARRVNGERSIVDPPGRQTFLASLRVRLRSPR